MNTCTTAPLQDLVPTYFGTQNLKRYTVHNAAIVGIKFCEGARECFVHVTYLQFDIRMQVEKLY